jgi:heme A synthase
MKLNAFAKFAWGVLVYNLVVILWGAFVRATGSGAGCGEHWPACNGEIFHRPESVETMIELSHRLTAGLALISVFVLIIWAFRSYPVGHRVRQGAVASTVLMIIEALIGAVLVLFAWVAADTSVERAAMMALHLINTFLLIGAILLTAWWASGGRPIRLGNGPVDFRWAVGASLVGMLILGASGAVTALGDTLLMTAGISPEDSPLLQTLLELRIYHPLIAFVVGGLIWLAVYMARRNVADPTLRIMGYSLLGIYVFQLFLGGLNVMLRAPVWLQLVHLLISNVIWILLVLVAAQRMAAPVPDSDPVPAPSALAQAGD